MSPNCKVQLENVRWLVWLWKGWTYWMGSGMYQPNTSHPPRPTCEACSGDLELMGVTNERGRLVWRKQLPKRGPRHDAAKHVALTGAARLELSETRCGCVELVVRADMNERQKRKRTITNNRFNTTGNGDSPTVEHQRQTAKTLDHTERQPNSRHGQNEPTRKQNPITASPAFLNRELEHRLRSYVTTRCQILICFICYAPISG